MLKYTWVHLGSPAELATVEKEHELERAQAFVLILATAAFLCTSIGKACGRFAKQLGSVTQCSAHFVQQFHSCCKTHSKKRNDLTRTRHRASEHDRGMQDHNSRGAEEYIVVEKRLAGMCTHPFSHIPTAHTPWSWKSLRRGTEIVRRANRTGIERKRKLLYTAGRSLHWQISSRGKHTQWNLSAVTQVQVIEYA